MKKPFAEIEGVSEMKRVPSFFVIVVMVVTLGIALGGKAEEPDIEKAETKFIPGDDIHIAYKVVGQGSPLVLIMGYSGTMDLWSPELLKELSFYHRVIIFDNRGMGKTTASEKKFSIQLFAKDTANLLDALHINRAHVLGWSMGTNIALELVLRYSAKVDKLILYAADCGGKEAIQPDSKYMKMMTDTSGTARERGERLLKILFLPKWLEEHPDLFSYFPRTSETSSTGNIGRQTKAMLGWEGAFSRLPRIKKSVLLITGTEDVLTPPKNSFIIAQRIPGSWVVQLKDGGHGVMYQYPKQMSRIIHTFIETQ